MSVGWIDAKRGLYNVNLIRSRSRLHLRGMRIALKREEACREEG